MTSRVGFVEIDCMDANMARRLKDKENTITAVQEHHAQKGELIVKNLSCNSPVCVAE